MVIPALLTDKRDVLLSMLELCKTFTDYVQIDIMDGDFVPSKSVTLDDISGMDFPIGTEAHLMVNNPIPWIAVFKKAGTKKIFFHYEAECDHNEVIGLIEAAGMQAGLVFNPGTDFLLCESLIRKVWSVLFMSVNPGFYGAPFIPEVLDKIKNFKIKYPDKSISIDGGVKSDNFVDIALAGVSDICIGSALIKAIDPAAAFVKFTKLFQSIK